jgi:putative restriction endonuclease
MPKAPSVPWTREHQLIALNLYCKLPFGKLHRGNGIIKEVAKKMGRTANSLALKLVNFASLDPILAARGIRGMAGASQADRRIWDEFHRNIAMLGPESEQLLHDLLTHETDTQLDLLQPDRVRIEKVPVETEGSAFVKVRRGQQFFRQSVLSAYGVACCISGVNIPELLIASHIRPWKDFPDVRLDPANGLCLSNLHDRAFDAGLITLDEKLQLVLSKRLRSFLPQATLEHSFLRFENTEIRLPEKLSEPSQEHLRYHRERIFQN